MTMLTLHTKLEAADRVDGELVLTYDQREKCRQRARLASGEEIALFTARGTVLQPVPATGVVWRVTHDPAAARPVAAAAPPRTGG